MVSLQNQQELGFEEPQFGPEIEVQVTYRQEPEVWRVAEDFLKFDNDEYVRPRVLGTTAMGLSSFEAIHRVHKHFGSNTTTKPPYKRLLPLSVYIAATQPEHRNLFDGMIGDSLIDGFVRKVGVKTKYGEETPEAYYGEGILTTKQEGKVQLVGSSRMWRLKEEPLNGEVRHLDEETFWPAREGRKVERDTYLHPYNLDGDYAVVVAVDAILPRHSMSIIYGQKGLVVSDSTANFRVGERIA